MVARIFAVNGLYLLPTNEGINERNDHAPPRAQVSVPTLLGVSRRHSTSGWNPGNPDST
jgi:hypothetical protein